MSTFIDSKDLADGLIRHMLWGSINAYHCWDARWLDYLDGVMCEPRLLYPLVCLDNYHLIEQVIAPYLQSLLENWEGDPDPELAFCLLGKYRWESAYQELHPELLDTIEQWLLGFVPKSRQSKEYTYQCWMTVLAAEIQGVDLPKLQKKLARKRGKSRYVELAYLRLSIPIVQMSMIRFMRSFVDGFSIWSPRV